MLPKGA
jgi:ABC-type bacteriocin/lantibiotic exporter with double-glycine peptidase domain